MKIGPILLKKEWKAFLAKEGFSLLQREDFPLDVKASITLFQSLCQIGKEANPHMAGQVKKTEDAIKGKGIDLKELLKKGMREEKVEEIADQFGLDKRILLFLIQNSTRPSIEAGVEKLQRELNTDNWLKGSCPVCGSLPQLSLLKEEAGKRFLLCSYCGYHWQAERMVCPFCNNKEQQSLELFLRRGGRIYSHRPL